MAAGLSVVQVDGSGSDVMLFAVCGVPFQRCIQHAREVLAAWDLPSLRAGGGGGAREKPPLVVAADAQRVRAAVARVCPFWWVLCLHLALPHTHTSLLSSALPSHPPPHLLTSPSPLIYLPPPSFELQLPRLTSAPTAILRPRALTGVVRGRA
jgi:hypothetical protein